jgi:hypothetical protein
LSLFDGLTDSQTVLRRINKEEVKKKQYATKASPPIGSRPIVRAK